MGYHFRNIVFKKNELQQAQLQWTPGISKWKLQTKVFLIGPMF